MKPTFSWPVTLAMKLCNLSIFRGLVLLPGNTWIVGKGNLSCDHKWTP
jgi:hypothetical protein